MSQDIFTLVHYNIKELDSVKLRQSNNSQLLAVKEILEKIDFDFLSINEIQYDLPSVPDTSYQTFGQNLKVLQSFIEKSKYKTFLSPANTGKKSRKMGDHYSSNYNDPKNIEFIDEDNFGLFPAQYSTGGLFRCDELRTVNIVTEKLWREVNDRVPWDKFKTLRGTNVNQNLALFDKSFNHLKCSIGAKKVDVILLHAVPAYHFGNKASINYLRNHDQLLFLEKYLEKINTPFIVAGDLNVDIHSQNLGAIVLKRLQKKYQFWMNEIPATHEGESLHRITLDYIFVGGGAKIIDGGVYGLEVGTLEYKLTRQASDHFPLWAKFQI